MTGNASIGFMILACVLPIGIVLNPGLFAIFTVVGGRQACNRFAATVYKFTGCWADIQGTPSHLQDGPQWANKEERKRRWKGVGLVSLRADGS